MVLSIPAKAAHHVFDHLLSQPWYEALLTFPQNPHSRTFYSYLPDPGIYASLLFLTSRKIHQVSTSNFAKDTRL